MKMTKEQQNILSERSKIIEMASPEYLKKKTNDNYQFIVQKILGLKIGSTKVNGVDMAQLIVESGLYSVIVGAYKDTVGLVNEIEETELGKFIDSLIATGIAGWRVVSANGKDKKLVAVQSSSFFETIVGDETIYTEFKIYKNDKDTYMFTRSYYPGYNELKLYKTNSTALIDAKVVPLTSIPETENFEERENTNMDIPSFKCIKKNDRIFESIKSLVDSIDRRLTEVELEFHKHIDAKVIYQNIDIPKGAKDTETGKILKEKLGNAFFANNSDADIKYIVNSNPMIDKAVDFIDRDIRRVSALSKVPLDYLGIDEANGGIGSESRLAKNAIFFSKATNIREGIVKMYQELIGSTITFGPMIGYADTNTGASGDNQGTAA